MNRALVDILETSRLTHVVDVGANPIDGDPPYKKMIKAGLVRVTGFEPQSTALEILMQKKGQYDNYFPHVVGRGNAGNLNICHYSGWTSLLTPRKDALEVFPEFKNNATVIDRVPVLTHRLDDMEGVDEFDMLKIDVQGGEMDVFEGGKDKIQRAAVVHAEISFIQLYERQAGFGEIDIFLRGVGFVPHHFAQIKSWPISSGATTPSFGNKNQLLEADLVYVKDFITLPVTIGDEKLKHLCLLAHYCYRSFDLSRHCVSLLVQRGVLPSDALSEYDGICVG